MGALPYTDEVDAKSRVMFSVHRDELYKIKQFQEADKLINVLLRLYTGLFADFVYIYEEVLARHAEMTRDQTGDVNQRSPTHSAASHRYDQASLGGLGIDTAGRLGV